MVEDDREKEGRIGLCEHDSQSQLQAYPACFKTSHQHLSQKLGGALSFSLALRPMRTMLHGKAVIRAASHVKAFDHCVSTPRVGQM